MCDKLSLNSSTFGRKREGAEAGSHKIPTGIYV